MCLIFAYQNLLGFLVRQSAIPALEVSSWDSPAVRQRDQGFGDEVSPLQLRQASDHILNVLTTKVADTHQVLYPALLEYVRPMHLQPALGTISRAITHILQTTHENDPVFTRLDFDRLGAFHFCVLKLSCCDE